MCFIGKLLVKPCAGNSFTCICHELSQTRMMRFSQGKFLLKIWYLESFCPICPWFKIHPKRFVMQIMTPFCIFPIYAGDKRRPLGNIAGLAFKSTLKSWKLILSSSKGHFSDLHMAQEERQVKRLIGFLGLGAERFGDRLVKYLTKALALNLDKTGHLPPGRRCHGLGSPASHKSSCHEAGLQGEGTSSLEKSPSVCNCWVYQ